MFLLIVVLPAPGVPKINILGKIINIYLFYKKFELFYNEILLTHNISYFISIKIKFF